MLRVILIIIVALSLTLASTAFFLLQQQTHKCTELTSQLDQAFQREKLIQSSLDSSTQQVQRLNILVKESQDKIETSNSETSSLENKNKGLSQELSQLKKHLQVTNNQNVDFIKQIDDLKVKLKQKERRVDALNKEKEDLASKLEKKRGFISLEKIVVGPQVPQELVQILEGKIVNVDKKFKFLIIDRGEKDYVNVGDVFSCFSLDKEIGDVKVEKVYETLSAANFLPNLQFRLLKKGLKVIRR